MAATGAGEKMQSSIPSIRPTDLFSSPEELAHLVDRFSEAKIAIVGDFFLDQYLIIDPTLAEPSVETGRTAHQVIGTRQSPGAAGTVANNIAALEAGEIYAVGVIGDDGNGYILRRELEKRGVDTTGLLVAASRFTPTYTKPMALENGVERETERIDIINRTHTPPKIEDDVIRAIDEVIGKVDAVILLDQVVRPDIGVLTARVRSAVCERAKKQPKTIFYADSRGASGEYRHVITKPNESEAIRAAGGDPKANPTDADVLHAARILFGRTGKPVYLTRGDKGMLVVSDQGTSIVPAVPVQGPLDICGAGDSATAGLVLSLACGATELQAALVGNIVASKTVVQIGTTGTTNRRSIKETSLDFG
jgi:rfaE bifunctional protein kinase chain/domain